MVLLVLAELLLFAGVLGASGVFEHLNQNDRDIMAQQIASRKDNLENYLVGRVGDLGALSDVINEQVAQALDADDLKLDDLGVDPDASKHLVNNLVEPMVQTLRDKSASGIFVVFNTADLSGYYETGEFGNRPGLYICDMDPEAMPSERNEDLQIVRASVDVVQAQRLTTDISWKPMFDFVNREHDQDYDFLYLPFQTAYEQEGPKTARDFAYWGIAPAPDAPSTEHVITYSVPLILGDGTVYGVVGLTLSPDYFRSLLPYNELLSERDGIYVFAQAYDGEYDDEAEQVAIHPIIASALPSAGGIAFGRDMQLERISGDSFRYSGPERSYIVDVNPLRLYDTNAPFENTRWVLAGAVPEETLHHYTNQVIWMIAAAALTVLLVGVVGSMLLGRSISNPLKGLSHEVAQARKRKQDIPELSRTGIAEVDELTGAISSLSRDVAEVKRAEQRRIERERDYDLLTGLMNRRSFYREARKVFSTPEYLEAAAIAMFDVDDLKDVNEKYGHACGDKLLKTAGLVIEAALPENVLVGRVSGDEFYLLFYGYENRAQIESQIQAICEALLATDFLFPDGAADKIKLSGGVAFYGDDGEDFAELMKLAEFTMYQVKLEGKNRVSFFDLETYQRQADVLKAMQELDELLSNFDLATYHFQPIFSARTGKAYAYEALMRISMEALQSPSDVFAFARQEKHLVDVERMTWNRALECYTELKAAGQLDGEAYLFINSIANLTLPEGEFNAVAQKHRSVMPNVVIEITEAESMDESATAIKRTIPGFSGFFALDDYGSGYNSELKLLELRPKFIKVDISIIHDIDSSIDRQRIVSQIVDYAHEREMLIVAEGIETAAELKMLLSLDVDLLQGYFLAHPAEVPEECSSEALAIIREHAPSGDQ